MSILYLSLIHIWQRKCAWNLDGAHAVVVNAEPLLPYTIDLFCIEHFDFFNQFIQHPGCQLFCSGVLANQTDKQDVYKRQGKAALRDRVTRELYAKRCAQARDRAEKELTEKINQLRSEIEKQSSRTMTTDMFISLVRKYTLSLIHIST